MEEMKNILKGIAIGLAIGAAFDLLLNTFSKNDKLISREGAAILSNPRDNASMQKAIKEAIANKSKTAEFTKSNGEPVSIIL
jgi:hypothetical protein